MNFNKSLYGHSALAALMVVCVLALMGGISHAGVADTAHDLSYDGPKLNYMTDQICVFCHTPHDAQRGIDVTTFGNATGTHNTSGDGALLLWNRAISNSSNTYQVYTSAQMDATLDRVRVYSLLCLSCHDGVGAMNVLSNYPNEDLALWDPDDPFNPDGSLKRDGGETDHQIGDFCPPGDPICGGINIGDMDPSAGDTVVDLRNDHPISFDYDVTLSSTDTGLAVPNNAQGYVIDSRVRLYPNPSGELKSLECSTCHDVHNQGSLMDGTSPFLVMSNKNSALCTNCHLK